MKTARLCIGIISMVLFLIIIFQSCAAGIGEALTGDESGSAGNGATVAWMMLIAGLVGLCTRKTVVGGYIAAAIYLIAGIIGVTSTGIFADLIIWGVVALIFAVVFAAGGFLTAKANKAAKAAEEAAKENTTNVTEEA